MTNLPPAGPPEPDFLPEDMPAEPEDAPVEEELSVDESSEVSMDSLPYDVESTEITDEHLPVNVSSLAQTSTLGDAAPQAYEASRQPVERCIRCGSTNLDSGALLTYGDRFRPAYYRPAWLTIRRLHNLLRPFRSVVEVQATVCRDCGLLTQQIAPKKLRQIEEKAGRNQPQQADTSINKNSETPYT